MKLEERTFGTPCMWFIGVELEQETSAPPPKKKILDPPLLIPSKTFLNEHLSLPNIGKTKSDLLTDTASLEIIAKLLTINYIY